MGSPKACIIFLKIANHFVLQWLLKIFYNPQEAVLQALHTHSWPLAGGKLKTAPSPIAG